MLPFYVDRFSFNAIMPYFFGNRIKKNGKNVAFLNK